MENYELLLTTQGEENIGETIECLIMAVNEIAQASENDFNAIKNKKWYNRLWEMVTFSKDNQKIQARGVANLAKLTEIVMKAIVLVSKQGAESSALLSQAIEKIEGNLEKIEFLTNNQIKIVNALKELKWGYKERLSVADLSVEKCNAMSAVFFKYIQNINEDIAENELAQRIFSLIYSPSAPGDLDYSILDTFNNDETILFYRLIQSYFYVATNQFDDDSEILEFIRISRKDEKTVKTDIQDTIKYLGKENYISAFDDGFDYRFVEDDLVEWEEIGGAFEKEDQAPNFVIFEDITISSMTHIAEGETLEYKNKNITIESIINCEGTLSLESCNITFNSPNKINEIELKDNSTLVAENCKFISLSHIDKTFIKCGDFTSVMFDKCQFNDCSNFIKNTSAYIKEFSIVNSTLTNCFLCFAVINNYGDYNDRRIVFKDNTINNESLLKPTGVRPSGYSHDIIYINNKSDNTEVCISNNLIVEKPEYRENISADNKLTYFVLTNSEISNCTFIGAEYCVEAMGVYDCVFKNCSSPTTIKYKGQLKNCLFRNCISSIRSEYGTTISNSKFVGCKGNLFNGSRQGGNTIEYCEIVNHINTGNDYTKSSIIFYRDGDRNSKSNTMQNCIFNGCVLNKNYLVSAHCYEKPRGIVGYIENCNFRNIKSKEKNDIIIRKKDSYFGFLDVQSEFDAISVYNCIGIENVNKEDSVADKSVRDGAHELENKIGANINK